MLFNPFRRSRPRPAARRAPRPRPRFSRPRLEALDGRICPALPPGWTLDAGGMADMTSSAFSATGELVEPTEGSYMLWLSSAGTTSTSAYHNSLNEPGTGGTIVRGPETKLRAGDIVSFDYFFSSSDYSPYNDFAVGLVSGTEVFSVTQTTGSPLSTGWRSASFAVPADGTYQLVLVATDERDNSVESELFVDNLTGFSLPDQAGDPEPPVVTLAATTATVGEGDAGTATFTLTRAGGSLDNPLTVTYWVYGDATPGEDYAELSGTVTFAAGSATATIEVDPVDDVVGENGESVMVVLNYPWDDSYVVGDPYWDEVTITDNDGGIATVTVEAAANSVSEGDPAITFTLTRTGGNTAAPLTVFLNSWGTAVAGVDYAEPPDSVTFAAGATTATVELALIDDALGETDESVTLYIGYPWDGTYQVGNPGWADTTIVDDDGGIATVGVQAALAGVDEGGGKVGAFTFTRTGGSLDAPLTVNYWVYGTASPGVDYAALPGSVTFAAGSATATVDLAPIDDAVGELDESVSVYVAYPWDGSYLINYQNWVANTEIVDDDGGIATVGVQAAVAGVAEGGGPVGAFTFTRTGGNLDAPLTVNYWVYGDATPGEDYAELSGTVTFAAGSATATVELAPIDDALGETNESVALYVAYPWDGSYIIDYQNWLADTEIIDDDGGIATVTLTAGATAVTEGEAATLTVTRAGGNLAAPLTVDLYNYGWATAGVDYEELPDSVVIPAGETSVSFPLTTIDDAVGENDESVTVYLGYAWSGNYLIGTPSWADVTIVDNDGGLATVTLTADATSVTEGGVAMLTVSRSGGNLAAPLTVSLYDYGWSATPGEDYDELPTEVVIPAGQASVTVPLTTIDDAVGESDESVYVSLGYSWNGDYLVGDPSWANVTIADNDGGLATVTLTAGATTVTEGESVTFTLSRTGGNLNAPLTVELYDYGWAMPGKDYEELPASVVIPAGQASVTFTLNTIDDVEGELEEDVTVYLNYPWNGNYIVGNPGWAEVMILDNDGGLPLVTVVASDAQASEDGDPGTFTVTRTGGNLDAPLTVYFYLWGSAWEGEDFYEVGYSVVIPAGATTATVQIDPIDDAIAEGDESVELYLDWDDHYVTEWGTDYAELIIVDND